MRARGWSGCAAQGGPGRAHRSLSGAGSDTKHGPARWLHVRGVGVVAVPGWCGYCFSMIQDGYLCRRRSAVMIGAMSGPEIRSRLAAMRADRRELSRAIAALERLEALRLARVVELVPRDIVLAAQRQMREWDAELPPAA